MGNLASSGTPRVSNCLLTDPSRSRHPHLPARRASSSASSTVRPGSHPPTRPGRRAPCARATRRGTQRQDPARGSSRAGRGPEAHAALARAVGRLREVGRPLGHLPVVVAPERASPRLAVLGRRRAYRCGSRVAVDSEVCTIDGHGDPPVGRGVSAPFCRDGTILAHGRSPWGPDPEISSTPSVRVISSSQGVSESHRQKLPSAKNNLAAFVA